MPDFEPNVASLKTHAVPDWFRDAKFGVMVHWGLYSIPGWAETPGTIQDVWGKRGPNYYFKHNPYAEWYANTIQIAKSGAQQHHETTHGGAPYESFAPTFDASSKAADLASWANLFADVGARYAVLITKHMDGYCLWPSGVPNPRRQSYTASRDIVAAVTTAVRARGLRMGLYYSAGYDMTFNATVIQDAASAIRAVPNDEDYGRYVHGQLVELIERHKPDVLWNDIAYPASASLEEILAFYYNNVPEGAVNDRWARIGPVRGVSNALLGGISAALPALWPVLPKSLRTFRVPQGALHDFATPEYATEHAATDHKWEAVRGIGPSFGNNRNETDAELPSGEELIWTLVDVVSKNGNLLLGVGPEPNGDIPEPQQQRLREIGRWLSINGEAIFGTRPWQRAEGTTEKCLPVRFTSCDDTLYAIVLGAVDAGPLVIKDVSLPPNGSVQLLGAGSPLAWEQHGPDLSITVPEPGSASAATAFRLGLSHS